MSFVIDPIPYIKIGLIGFMSIHMLDVHVHKHHQAYVDTANKLVPQSEFANSSIDEIIQKSSGVIFNNVAQHFNHNFFWHCLTAEAINIPEPVTQFLNKNFKTVDAFKEEFTSKASSIFGSGWCYLAMNADGTVSINQYSNAENPIKYGGFPILGLDTWEHAWYIDYENVKANYFKNFWDKVNWTFVQERLEKAGLI